MAEEHIGRELLGRFLQVEVSKEESRNVVRHLLTGCPECAELAHRLSAELCLWGRTEGVPAIWEERYEEVFRRALVFATEEEQRTALEKLRGWGQWAALERLNPQARFALVETDPAYHTFGLYDRLLEASRWSMHTSPADAVDVVRLAILVAERLDAERFGAGRIADLRAAAWAVLGNVERLASNSAGFGRAQSRRHLLPDQGVLFAALGSSR